MADRRPGDIVHYRASGSNLPMWPAVICTDDVAPPEFLRSRPVGYVTLVLRLGEYLDFHWAMTTEIYDYNKAVPFEDEEMVASTPGLGEAYAIADSALDADLGLQHWKTQVRHDLLIISSDEDSEDDQQLEAEFDQDLQRAIQMSLEEPKGQLKRYSTPPLPLSKRAKILSGQQSSREVPGSSFATEVSSKPKFVKFSTTPKYDLLSLPIPTEKEGSCKYPTIKRKQRQPTFPETGESSKAASTSKIDDLLSWDRLGKTSVPTCDNIEEDLSASKEYVQLRVGPDREERLLHKKSVWDRPYFREPRIGLMRFELTDSGMWELNHPALTEIDPEEFALIAEYLESGSFGNRYPRDGKEMDEAFIQMGSAWETAERLGMTDLMDHIVERLEFLQPWDLLSVLAFACTVYASPGPFLPAQEGLKDMLTTHMAEHYWVYIEDDHLNAIFIQRLKEFPALDLDICVERAKALEAQLDTDDDEEEGEDDDENGGINLD